MRRLSDMAVLGLLLPLVACGAEEEAAAVLPETTFVSVTPPGHPVVASPLGRDLTAHDLFLSFELAPEDAMTGAFRPRKDLPVWRHGDRIDWQADPFDDRNWRYQLHALRPLDPLLLGFERSGDPAFLLAAKAIALDWIASHPQGPRGAQADGDEGEDGDMSWYDMGTGLRALRFAYLAQAIRSGALRASSDERAMLLRSVEEHAAVLSNPHFFTTTNHGIFIVHGLMAACRVLDERADCPSRRAYARDRMIEILTTQYRPDGGHAEHSPSYHTFVLGTLERVTATGWYGFEDNHRQTLQRARQVAGWMADATGKFPNIGDSERKLNPDAMRALPPAEGCGDAPAADLPRHCFGFRFLPETGYAVLRTVPNVPKTSQSSVFVTCSFFSPTHKHQDELSFEWVEGGLHVLVDSGKFAYERNETRDYVLSRPAHNAVFFPHAPLRRGEGGGACISSATFDGDALSVDGSFALSDEAVHRRQIDYRPGQALWVTDRIEQRGKPQPFEIRWHFGPELKVRHKTDAWLVSRRDGTPFAEAALDGACQWRLVGERDEHHPAGSGYSATYRERENIDVIAGACPARTEAVTLSVYLAELGKQDR